MQLLCGRCRGCDIVRFQLRRALLDLFLVLACRDAYESAGVLYRRGIGLTQFLAEGGVVSTLVVEIEGVGERASGNGDASDSHSGRSLHGCSGESGVAGDG